MNLRFSSVIPQFIKDCGVVEEEVYDQMVEAADLPKDQRKHYLLSYLNQDEACSALNALEQAEDLGFLSAKRKRSII